MGTRISFKRPDGKTAEGYLAKAGRDHAPGVVVIQEWWGLQDQIRGICDRLALAGYEALAPDLYAGRVVPYHDAAAAGREMSSLNFLDATDQVVRGAAQYLARSGAKVGITGFCMGGAVTILSAIRVPEFSCAAPFYGMPPAEVANPAQVKVPVQGHYANRDDYFTPQTVDVLEAGLKSSGQPCEVFRYDADHGFMNEQRDVHSREACELAWQRFLPFLKANLGG